MWWVETFVYYTHFYFWWVQTRLAIVLLRFSRLITSCNLNRYILGLNTSKNAWWLLCLFILVHTYSNNFCSLTIALYIIITFFSWFSFSCNNTVSTLQFIFATKYKGRQTLWCTTNIVSDVPSLILHSLIQTLLFIPYMHYVYIQE